MIARRTVKFSQLSVHSFFERDGQKLLKISSFEVNREERNAVLVYGEQYVFVQEDEDVLIRK